MPDTYTVAQTAQILGVSERRVRQLVASGALPATRDGNGALHLAQAAVNAERKQRRGAPGSRTAKAAGSTRRTPLRAGTSAVDVDELASAVAAAVGKNLEGQLELTRRAESLIRQELDEERARRAQAEQRLAEAEAESERLRKELATANDRRRRPLFRRT